MISFCHRLRSQLEKPSSLVLRFLILFFLPLSMIYTFIMTLRRQAYQRGIFTVHPSSCPVISVGNLTAGGTGKTPMVLWLCQTLLKRGIIPGVASRGYGTSKGLHGNDEESMLREKIPGALFASNPKRFRAVLDLISQGAKIVILDDGFQHLSVRRDLDLVLIDALSPDGGGRCFPVGLLRESWSTLAAASVLVITRSDQVSVERHNTLRRALGEVAPGVPQFSATHKPCRIFDFYTGEDVCNKSLTKCSVAMLSSIARPESFAATLESLGLSVTESICFPDHYAYTRTEIELFINQAKDRGVDSIVTTEKDLPKLRLALQGDTLSLPILVLSIELCIADDNSLIALINSAISQHNQFDLTS